MLFWAYGSFLRLSNADCWYRFMEVNVELYVKQKDRWLIDATFPGHQESVAVEEAKEMSQQRHVQAVKVIREAVDPATGAKQEKTVYTTEPEKTGDDYDSVDFSEAVSEDSAEDSGSDWAVVDDEEPAVDEVGSKGSLSRRERKTSAAVESKVGLIIKLLMIVSFSLGFAAIVSLMFQRFGYTLYGSFGIGF